MTTLAQVTPAIDPFEKVVEVEVMVSTKGTPASVLDKDSKVATREAKRFVIADTHPDVSRVAHYRTDSPLSSPQAWIASVNGARWFMTRKKAQAALYAMRAERMMEPPLVVKGKMPKRYLPANHPDRKG